jgi:carbonic anhydrase
VEVPFIAGRRSNNMLARIWENLPERPGATYSGRQVGINPTFLLPNDRSYYAYLGSLATPPCSEGVQWFVFREPVEVDASYIRRLLDLVGPNARPVQPLNGRPISLQSR